ncbi:MAG: hypothetical protein AAF215_25280 [Cyanobacteria bacterium P01_A01_bin.123]
MTIPLQSSSASHLGAALIRFTGAIALSSSFLVSCSTSPLAETTGYQAQLADHLTAQGSKMYGAFWCPHCAAQKERFGDAVDHIPYVECDPSGENAQPDLCQAKSIQAYPTWEISGQFYLGVQSLEELAALSGFSVGE